MSEQVNNLIRSANFQRIVNRTRGEWLEADSSGQLHSVKGFYQKSWFVFRNILSCGGVLSRTAAVINKLGLGIFSGICHGSPAPIHQNSPLLVRYRNRLTQLIGSIERISPKISSPNNLAQLKDLIEAPQMAEARYAIQQGIPPKALEEGISGSYILQNRLNQPCGIFKPSEQEAGTGANPKGFQNLGQFLSNLGVSVGTSYQRERAVYLLDRDHYMGVPPTVIATLPGRLFNSNNPSLRGSFQSFVPNCTHAWDHYQILPWPFSSADGDRIPDHEIHKLAILDIRTLNCDRHLKNFLIDSEYRVHPIDHGYALPGKASNLRFNWMNFKQANTPFSHEELQYIERINPREDCALFKREVPSLSEKSLLRFQISATLLKRGAQRGLTAYQIGDLMIGAHQSAFANLVNQFIPIPTDHPSYFEERICRPLIYSHGSLAPRDIERSIDREIDRYLGIN